jgi:hypothetical protein
MSGRVRPYGLLLCTVMSILHVQSSEHNSCCIDSTALHTSAHVSTLFYLATTVCHLPQQLQRRVDRRYYGHISTTHEPAGSEWQPAAVKQNTRTQRRKRHSLQPRSQQAQQANTCSWHTDLPSLTPLQLRTQQPAIVRRHQRLCCRLRYEHWHCRFKPYGCLLFLSSVNRDHVTGRSPVQAIVPGRGWGRKDVGRTVMN